MRKKCGSRFHVETTLVRIMCDIRRAVGGRQPGPATGVALWMAGKIFCIGILRTGQPPKVVEMLRWAMRKSD